MMREEIDEGTEKGSKAATNQQIQDGYCKSRAHLEELGGPDYQTKQSGPQHPFYTPGSKRGRKAKVETANKFRIISNNCATMAPKRAEIEGWEADVIALQETRLGSIGQIATGARLRKQNASFLR